MNPAAWALENRIVVMVLTVVMMVVGLNSYTNLSRLEDPEFTIKNALVLTPYPGASAEEVEKEVSDVLETAIQQMGQLREIESKSERGLSTITVTIKDEFKKDELPQVWDELRRKVGDAQSSLPPGASASVVNDDFGDVWGVYYALYGDEYTERELYEVAKFLRRELTLEQDVAKVDIIGERSEVIYVEPDRDRMAQLGIPLSRIVQELREKNAVSDAGHVTVGSEFITIAPTGVVTSTEDFELILLSGEGSERQIYLRDVATVRRDYQEPERMIIGYDGHKAIGLAISTISGGNVVLMGAAIDARLAELQSEIPLGIQLGVIAHQAQAVDVAISGFVISLLEAVAIVVFVLLFFMGLRSGLIIGFVLMLTIAATFIFMGPQGVALERISLGALIIALGMLVDNAIVVVDGVLVRLPKGIPAEQASKEIVAQTAIPLAGATLVAILAFGAIGLSDDSTGEYCRSLFIVVAISLSLSWVTAVTVTPLLCVWFLKADPNDTNEGTNSPFFRRYKAVISALMAHKWLTTGGLVGVFLASLYAFQFVDKSFFPDSTRPQFMIDLFLPNGVDIQETRALAAEVDDWLRKQEGVTHVTTHIGGGAPRFLLTYDPEKSSSAYALFLVDVTDASVIPAMSEQVEHTLAERYPAALAFTRLFVLGPGGGAKVETRVMGPDADVVREIASKVEDIYYANPLAKGVRTTWRERSKVLEPVIADEQANLNGLAHSDVSQTLRTAFEGLTVGVYREGDELLPITLRAQQSERADVAQIQNLQIWSPAKGGMIPLRQVVPTFRTTFEDPIIWRLDRTRNLEVGCDPVSGPASVLLEQVRPQIEALELPHGYHIEFGGEYENSARAQKALAGNLPAFLGLMALVVIALFNSLKQPAIILANVPLALIGVSFGLLLAGQPFGFMALLGFLSLSGMLIKNAIVLIDEINVQIAEGRTPWDAVVESAASRLRPVGMAASTTALGMVPLLLDAFFVSMAVTIIAGLVVATVLVMVVVPVLYAVLYQLEKPASEAT